MKTHLYRAIALDDYEDEYTREPIYWVGSVIGRQTGYLSRSAAVDAGRRSGIEFEIIRSEPVIFLTRAEQLQKRINELTADLEVVQRPVRINFPPRDYAAEAIAIAQGEREW